MNETTAQPDSTSTRPGLRKSRESQPGKRRVTTTVRDAASLLTIRQAAAAAGWSRQGLYDTINAGLLPVTEIGIERLPFIDPLDLAVFLNQKKNQAARARKGDPAPWLADICQKIAQPAA